MRRTLDITLAIALTTISASALLADSLPAPERTPAKRTPAEETPAEETPAEEAPREAAPAAWTQWGGPNRNFVIEDGPSLAASWPEAGPPRLWQRPLGGGYSQILASDGSLYVTFRRGDDDVVAALDAASGETRWEHSYTAVPYPEQTVEFGTGPNATPLLAGGRLVAVGFTGRILGLDPATGEVAWSHDLLRDFGGKQQRFGYSAAPIAYRSMAIVLVGGDRHGALGLDLETGEVRWQAPALDISYASPIAIELGGEDQLVFMTSKEIVGVGLADAWVSWRHPHKNQYGNNCAGPWWGPDGLMFVSSQADGGSRTLRLAADGGKIRVEEVARDRGVKIFHNSAVRLDDHVYGASGSILVAYDLKTGEQTWKERGYPEANLVVADGKTLLLDEGGRLTLTTLSPEKLTVHSRTQLLSRPAWTAPTLAGTRLYARDKSTIVALELAPQD